MKKFMIIIITGIILGIFMLIGGAILIGMNEILAPFDAIVTGTVLLVIGIFIFVPSMVFFCVALS